MNVKSFHPSIIKKIVLFRKKIGDNNRLQLQLIAFYAMKVWPKKEQNNKRTKQCP
jgi:hypothetical protein